jgi:hypothetical protein
MKAYVWLALASFCFFVSYAKADGLPPYVTAAARAACETDVRRYCVKGHTNFNAVKGCVAKHFKKMNMNCQTEIVNLLPQIEAYEKRKRNK